MYVTRGQGAKFKYSNKWLATHDSKFLFENQTADNIFWSLTSGCITWTHRLIHWKPLYKASHYLHHRFFTVNFGNGAAPLDKWFGSFHDGSPDAHAAEEHRKLQGALLRDRTLRT